MFNISSTKRGCPSCIGCEQSAAKRDGRPKKASTDAGLSDVGISFDQFSRWQKLAAVPEEIFERQMQDKTHMPTMAAIYPATPWAAMTRSSLAARCGRSICSMAMPVEICQTMPRAATTHSPSAEARDCRAIRSMAMPVGPYLAMMSGNAHGGNDVLVSGTGNDQMWGDAQVVSGNAQGGNDTSVFKPGNGHDTIGDFGQG